MKQKISRRQFLKAGCITAAAAGASACGIGIALSASGGRGSTCRLQHLEVTVWEQGFWWRMPAGPARPPAWRMRSAAPWRRAARGWTCGRCGRSTDVTPYAAVVAGSAIQGGWLPEGIEFVRAHRADLARKPFAAFMVCITLAMRGGENYRAGLGKKLDPVRALVPTVSEGMFAGMLDLDKLPAGDRAKMSIPVALGIFPQGDHRDWEKIQAWAEALRPKLGVL